MILLIFASEIISVSLTLMIFMMRATGTAIISLSSEYNISLARIWPSLFLSPQIVSFMSISMSSIKRQGDLKVPPKSLSLSILRKVSCPRQHEALYLVWGVESAVMQIWLDQRNKLRLFKYVGSFRYLNKEKSSFSSLPNWCIPIWNTSTCSIPIHLEKII